MHFCPDVLQVTDVPDLAPPAPAEACDGIVGALMMVMHKRSKVIHSSGKFCSFSTLSKIPFGYKPKGNISILVRIFR